MDIWTDDHLMCPPGGGKVPPPGIHSPEVPNAVMTTSIEVRLTVITFLVGFLKGAWGRSRAGNLTPANAAKDYMVNTWLVRFQSAKPGGVAASFASLSPEFSYMDV